jgi:hypothetical protein
MRKRRLLFHIKSKSILTISLNKLHQNCKHTVTTSATAATQVHVVDSDNAKRPKRYQKLQPQQQRRTPSKRSNMILIDYGHEIEYIWNS